MSFELVFSTFCERCWNSFCEELFRRSFCEGLFRRSLRAMLSWRLLIQLIELIERCERIQLIELIERDVRVQLIELIERSVRIQLIELMKRVEKNSFSSSTFYQDAEMKNLRSSFLRWAKNEIQLRDNWIILVICIFVFQHFSFKNVYINCLHSRSCCFTFLFAFLLALLFTFIFTLLFTLWTKTTKTSLRNLRFKSVSRSWVNLFAVTFTKKKKKMSFLHDERRLSDFVATRRNLQRSRRKFIEDRTKRRIFEHIMSKESSLSTKLRKWFVRDVQSFYLILSSKQITRLWLII